MFEEYDEHDGLIPIDLPEDSPPPDLPGMTVSEVKNFTNFSNL